MPSNKPEKAREYYLNYKETLQERNKNKRHCCYCKTDISPWNWAKHTKTNKHIREQGIKEEDLNIQSIQICKDYRTIWYKDDDNDDDRCSEYEKYLSNQYDLD